MERSDAVIETVTISASRPVVRLADPVARLMAIIMDHLILGVAFAGTSLIARYFDWYVPDLDSVATESMIVYVAWALGLFLMINIVPMRATGQTWGKRWQEIAVVDMQGNKATLGRQVMRYALQQISFLSCLINLLNALLIFREDRRCGHDHIMGTRVIEFP